MKFLALVSGGKDSIYSIIESINHGHELVAIGHLEPNDNIKEIDSYMYQTVGSELINAIGQCLQVPVIIKQIKGTAINKELIYEKTENDEVENLYELIYEAKIKYPQIQSVCSGAILSNYQKNRVENICNRLGLISLSYLWQRSQNELLQNMIDNNIDAYLIKVCSMGLNKNDVMKSIKDLYNKFVKLNSEFGLNICGEGGEYETITLDCSIYKKKIVVDDYSIICHSSDPFSPVYYAIINKYHLEDK